MMTCFSNPSSRIVLNRHKHKTLKIQHLNHWGFASHLLTVPIFMQEFVEAGKHYPLFFRQYAENEFMPIALMGLNQRHAYINAQGQWQGAYLPAVMRMYPFSIEKNANTWQVSVEKNYAGLNPQQGESFFDNKGNPSSFLKKTMTLLKQYHQYESETQWFCAKLRELQLLELTPLNLTLPDGSAFNRNEEWFVSEAKLNKLSNPKLSDLVRSGALRSIYASLFSVSNLRTMMQMLAKR